MNNYFQLEAEIGVFIEAPSDRFTELALEVYKFQRHHNAPYSKYCAHLHAPEQLPDWRMIPAVPQNAFKQLPLRCFQESDTIKTFRTSGTTGEGFGCHHFCSLFLYQSAVLAGWDRLQLPRLPQIVLTPTPEQAPHSSLSQMMGYLGERTAHQQFCMELDQLPSMIPEEPVLLLGTALAYLNFFERGHKLQLPPGSLAMETGGYKGSGRDISKPALYAQFHEFLGLSADSILNEYGMTELSSQFYSRGLGNPHTGAPWIRALVIDPETGAEAEDGLIGCLRIFDLANLGSVMAIQTRDLAIRRGAEFELLGRDPAALPRGCSRSADELLSARAPNGSRSVPQR